MDDFHPGLGLIVEKRSLRQNGEYNLSGDSVSLNCNRC